MSGRAVLGDAGLADGRDVGRGPTETLGAAVAALTDAFVVAVASAAALENDGDGLDTAAGAADTEDELVGRSSPEAAVPNRPRCFAMNAPPPSNPKSTTAPVPARKMGRATLAPCAVPERLPLFAMGGASATVAKVGVAPCDGGNEWRAAGATGSGRVGAIPTKARWASSRARSNSAPFAKRISGRIAS